LTTIAIIGGGIAARSLLFALAKKNFSQKILVFYSDRFAFPCSLHSTAIVAPRGISTGHSNLGDELVEGFQCFSRHFSEDSPEGVIKVPQFTGAFTKVEAFRKRYPEGALKKNCGAFELKNEMYVAHEEAYLIRPAEYMSWLLEEASRTLHLEVIPSFVTEISGQKIRTQEGKEFLADKIIFAAGVQNELWSGLFPETKKSKSVQGSYLEFQDADLGDASFSLTLEGNNLIYDSEKKSLLIGSTTRESSLELAPERELLKIYQNLSQHSLSELPEFSRGMIRVGLREKASRREAYLVQHNDHLMLGGLYKNGYRMSLLMAQKLIAGL